MTCQSKECTKETEQILCVDHLKKFIDLMSDRTESMLRLHGDCTSCGETHDDQDCPYLDVNGIACTDKNCTDHDDEI